MATTVLLDEWHLSVRIPAALPAPTVSAIRRALIDNLQADEAIEALAETLPDLSALALCDVVQAAIPAGGVWWRMGEQAIDKGAAPPVGLLTRALQAATEDGWGSE